MQVSEYVSIGHPDKVADYISQYLLDRYIERDPDTRYAVEVQIKDTFVTLGGEITSKTTFTTEQIANFVREAVAEIGYTRGYQEKWGTSNTISADNIVVSTHIGHQSPDIAVGIENKGWGDQGIFFGMCKYNICDTTGMPLDHSIAKKLCHDLFYSDLGGLDIKTQIITECNTLRQLIVAIPIIEECKLPKIKSFIRCCIPGDYELIVNGTGIYKRHGSIADCGTTGRKLAVDFYGGNCFIGGGSPWTKDASKADLTLNLLARKLAKQYCREFKTDVFTKLSCCIGSKEVRFAVYNRENNLLDMQTIIVTPAELKRKFELDKPIFASMCRWGLFGEYQSDKVWEKDG